MKRIRPKRTAVTRDGLDELLVESFSINAIFRPIPKWKLLQSFLQHSAIQESDSLREQCLFGRLLKLCYVIVWYEIHVSIGIKSVLSKYSRTVAQGWYQLYSITSSSRVLLRRMFDETKRRWFEVWLCSFTLAYNIICGIFSIMLLFISSIFYADPNKSQTVELPGSYSIVCIHVI